MRCGTIALIGRPNAGKSTLLNRIVGQKLAIVSDKPQTTRTRIIGVKQYPDAQAVFVDTPGIQSKHASRLNERMNRSATRSLEGVDHEGLPPPPRRHRAGLDQHCSPAHRCDRSELTQPVPTLAPDARR